MVWILWYRAQISPDQLKYYQIWSFHLDVFLLVLNWFKFNGIVCQGALLNLVSVVAHAELLVLSLVGKKDAASPSWHACSKDRISFLTCRAFTLDDNPLHSAQIHWEPALSRCLFLRTGGVISAMPPSILVPGGSQAAVDLSISGPPSSSGFRHGDSCGHARTAPRLPLVEPKQAPSRPLAPLAPRTRTHRLWRRHPPWHFKAFVFRLLVSLERFYFICS
jgi:hypothetical protein